MGGGGFMGWVIRDPRIIRWGGRGGFLDPRGSVIRGPPTTQPTIQGLNFQRTIQGLNFKLTLQGPDFQPTIQGLNFRPTLQGLDFQPTIQTKHPITIIIIIININLFWHSCGR